MQDLGDGGKAYSGLLNTIVRYVKREFPENIQFIEEEHDVSLVLGEFWRVWGISLIRAFLIWHLCDIDTAISEEGTQAITSNDIYTASIVLTPVIVNLPAPLRDIPEQSQPRTLSQFHDVRELGDISVTAYSHRITANISPSQMILPSLTSLPKRKCRSKFKRWFTEWRHCRTKK